MSVLDPRLDARVDAMLEQGLVAELTDFHRQYNTHRLQHGQSVPGTVGVSQYLPPVVSYMFHRYIVLVFVH